MRRFLGGLAGDAFLLHGGRMCVSEGRARARRGGCGRSTRALTVRTGFELAWGRRKLLEVQVRLWENCKSGEGGGKRGKTRQCVAHDGDGKGQARERDHERCVYTRGHSAAQPGGKTEPGLAAFAIYNTTLQTAECPKRRSNATRETVHCARLRGSINTMRSHHSLWIPQSYAPANVGSASCVSWRRGPQ